jgi:hypothetical protein
VRRRRTIRLRRIGGATRWDSDEIRKHIRALMSQETSVEQAGAFFAETTDVAH